MTKQVRFDSLKPGDCFEYYGQMCQRVDHSLGVPGYVVCSVGLANKFVWCGFGEKRMVTPRPDITEAIKKIVGGVDGTR